MDWIVTNMMSRHLVNCFDLVAHYEAAANGVDV